MQKITSNEVLENISVIQLSEVLCELDLMGALKNDPWRSLQKLADIYANLNAWNDNKSTTEQQAEKTIKTYSNKTYDRNLNEPYDAYVNRRALYQTDQSAEHKENMIDALNRLLTEVSDFTTLIWNNATFTEERDLISGMLEVIARH